VTKTDAELVALLSLEHPEKPHNVLAKLRGTYSFVVKRAYLDVVRLIVNDTVEANLLEPRALVRAAHRADHARALHLRQLAHQRAHRARRTRHHQRLACPAGGGDTRQTQRVASVQR
jgi:hypothetical protein